MRSLALAAPVLLILTLVAPLRAQSPPAPAKPLAPGRIEVAVKDMHCATCAKKVARKLYAVKGVKKVSPSLKDDLVVVFLPAKGPVPAVALWQAVAAGGVHPVELRYGDKRLDVEQMKPLLAAARSAVTR